MKDKINRVYIPMTETGFYILYCLQEEMHGSLSKMEKDGLIKYIKEEDKRKIYCITELGTEVLELEMKRIERLYKNMVETK